jgi:hypothetical protein
MMIKNFKLENNGQLTIEFLFLISFTLVLILAVVNIISYENDLNLAMAAARTGANFASNENTVAIYDDTAYQKYSENNTLLTHPNAIKIVKIDKLNRGFDSRYNRTSIQLRIYASSPTLLSRDDRLSAGERINYNVKKSITLTFNTNKLTNTLYNPCFSNQHVYTTANVQWV